MSDRLRREVRTREDRRRRRPRRETQERPQIFGKTLFVDLMMSTLIVVTALLIASNAAEREEKKPKKEDGLATVGIYAIVASWPDAMPDDVDLHVRDPSGQEVYYNARDLGLMHLEHDDQGQVSDTSGGVTVRKNEERVVIRGAVPGEYVVRVHMYAKHAPNPTRVAIRLVSLKGEDADVVAKERVLASDGQWETAFRFTLSADEKASNVNELPYTGGP